MRGKTLLKGMMALAITGTAFAGSTSVDVPVTIDYSAGCVLNLPASVDLGTIPTLQPKGNGSYLPPISFTVKCTNGLNYQVTLDNLDSYGNIALTNSTDNSTMLIGFATDNTYSSYLYPVNNNNVVATGTGDETDHTITLYMRVGKVGNGNYNTALNACSTGDVCTQGTYTGTLTVGVTW